MSVLHNRTTHDLNTIWLEQVMEQAFYLASHV